MTTTLFQTERILARTLDAADLDAMMEVYGNADAMRWVGDGQPITIDQCVRWVEVTRRNYETRGYGMSVLTARESGETLGFCGIVHPGGQPEPEIKYALKREYWGRGLATEAVGAMLEYGRRTFQLEEIIATIAPGNAASRRVLEKVGMAFRDQRMDEHGEATDVLAWRAGPKTGT